MNTLLLTGTVQPYPVVSQSWYSSTSLNPSKRLAEYMDSIIYYISQSAFSYIVFCENSDYAIPAIDLQIIEDLCEYYHKKFELLQFKWDYDMVVKKWYNYWYW